jgi:hypothetical protein
VLTAWQLPALAELVGARTHYPKQSRSTLRSSHLLSLVVTCPILDYVSTPSRCIQPLPLDHTALVTRRPLSYINVACSQTDRRHNEAILQLIRMTGPKLNQLTIHM